MKISDYRYIMKDFIGYYMTSYACRKTIGNNDIQCGCFNVMRAEGGKLFSGLMLINSYQIVFQKLCKLLG